MSDAMPSGAVPGLICHTSAVYNKRTCLKQITQTAFYENEEFATPFTFVPSCRKVATTLRLYALSIRTHSGTLVR